ncbi:MAG TPA: hypothetical protein VHP83_07320 [Aggregatilineaceae bacterium]|nr:hypothetical protein [Aggregatilineaceae bacterium]
MARFTAFSDDCETIGQIHLSLFQSINYENFSDYLAKHRLKEIDPGKWYPMQMILDLFSDIVEQGGGMMDLVSIGLKIMELAVLPPPVEAMPFGEVLMQWNEIYHINNRGTDPGGFVTEKISDTHYKIIARQPYPDDYTYGVLYGGAKRWLPQGTQFTVYYDPDLPRREDGGDVTVIHAEW